MSFTAMSLTSPVSTRTLLRQSARTTRRQVGRPAGRTVTAAAAGRLNQKGTPGIHNIFVVPKDQEAYVDKIWKTHEVFMNDTHTVGPAGTDAVPRLAEYYVSKGYEHKDPMDPESELTGNVVYILNETYFDSADITKHMELANSKDALLDELKDLRNKYGAFTDVGSTSVVANFVDEASPCTVRKRDTNITVAFSVPAGAESEVDTLFHDHEKFMRETHQLMGSGDDLERPRITHYSVTKGKERLNPLDASTGFTGNILYVVNEVYMSPDGVQGHFKASKAQTELKARFDKIFESYGTFINVDSTVLTCMNQSLASNIVKALKKVVSGVKFDITQDYEQRALY